MRGRFGIRRTLGRGVIVALLGSAAAAGLTSAATYHVRIDGDDFVCSGLVDAPATVLSAPPRPCAFRTPQHAVDTAEGGDTVRIHSGTYTQAGTTVQGNSDIIGIDLRPDSVSETSRLVIESAGDGPVVFVGGELASGVTIWGTSYVTIQGITFRGFTADRSPLLAYGAAAVNVGSPGPENPSSSIVLRNLTVDSSTLDNLTGSSAEIAIWCQACTNNTIEGCRIESVEPAAIAVGSPTAQAVEQGGVLSGNTIVHVREAQSWRGVLATHTSGWRVRGNYFDDASTNTSTTDEISVTDSAGWEFLDNVFYRPPRNAINLIDQDADGTNNEGHLVLNNTIDCDTRIGKGVRLEKCNDCEVRNNIIVGCTAGVALAGDDSGSELGFNDLFHDSSLYDNSEFGFGYTLVGHDIASDPLFQGTLPRPDPFYRLRTLSPAINSGDDAFCADVPADGQCDMGAFQPPEAGVNHPPAQPSIVLIDKITGKSARLHGSPFSDPDQDDHQQASQWQADLATADFTNPVRDSGRTDDGDHFNLFRVGGLNATTSYKSRVRYQDNQGAWSPWSDPAIDTEEEFTTCVATAIPPKVVAVSPARGTKNVPITVAPALTFNVPLEAARVTTSTIKIFFKGHLVAQAPESPSLDGSGLVVTITPEAPLAANARYRIAVVGGAAGVHSRDCSVPGRSFSSRFKTETPIP